MKSTYPAPDLDNVAFFEVMAKTDALTVVIKAAAYIQYQLQQLLEEALVEPAALKDVQLDYSGQCSLAVALGLDKRFLAPLKALGKIRNKFAHAPDAELNKNDCDNLYKALSQFEREMLQDIFKKIMTRRGNPKARLADQPLLDQFSMVAVSLRAALMSARRLATSQRLKT